MADETRPEFASAISPEMREQITREQELAARREDNAQRLEQWRRTRGTTNRYHWKARYLVQDGVLRVVYPDGSGGVYYDSDREPVTADLDGFETVVGMLNNAMAQMESLAFRDGILHSVLGIGGTVASGVAVIRQEGVDHVLEDCDGQDVGEWLVEQANFAHGRLDEERIALREMRRG